MSTKEQPREIARAQRELANMRSFVRRKNLTGWVKDRDAGYAYRSAFAAIVRVEDAHGVEVAGPLSNRLMRLRQEATERHLLRIEDVGRLEREAIAEVDRSRA